MKDRTQLLIVGLRWMEEAVRGSKDPSNCRKNLAAYHTVFRRQIGSKNHRDEVIMIGSLNNPISN
jgi:hypothetical protein